MWPCSQHKKMPYWARQMLNRMISNVLIHDQNSACVSTTGIGKEPMESVHSFILSLYNRFSGKAWIPYHSPNLYINFVELSRRFCFTNIIATHCCPLGNKPMAARLFKQSYAHPGAHLICTGRVVTKTSRRTPEVGLIHECRQHPPLFFHSFVF